mmetsp:Transcript_7131/g.20250  ORF Transcript_7131/g.20250 Transcript_7131/m.20250 type:complete len:221 (+) Transcript_7131:722-1384(+)
MRRNVHVHRVLVFAKSIDNHGSKLEDFSSHVTRASRESTPVGKDHDGKAFLGKVTDGLSSLVRRVGEQDLTSLRKNGLTRVGVSRVGGDDLLDLAGFNSNGTHGNTSQTSTTNDNGLAPSSEVFLETSLVKESTHGTISSHHQARIVGGRSGLPCHLTVNRIGTVADSRESADILGDETQPLDHGGNTGLVVLNNLVRHTVGVHDLRSSKLVIRIVDLTP